MLPKSVPTRLAKLAVLLVLFGLASPWTTAPVRTKAIMPRSRYLILTAVPPGDGRSPDIELTARRRPSDRNAKQEHASAE